MGRTLGVFQLLFGLREGAITNSRGRESAQAGAKPDYLEKQLNFEPLCVWKSSMPIGSQCRTRGVHLCREWERLRRSSPEDGIDVYTRYHFNTICRKKNAKQGKPCIQLNNQYECENLDQYVTPDANVVPDRGGLYTTPAELRKRRKDQEHTCTWYGDEIDAPWGSCAGSTPHIDELIIEMQDVFHEEGLVSKQAQFSYIVNVFDCKKICMESCLSVLKAYCPTLKHCCEWHDGLRTCISSNHKIAKRYNPRLVKLATLEFTCRTQSSWDTCAGINANDSF